MSSPEEFPSPFGRYALLSRLARGGMGELFIARMAGAAGWEKRVVIKRLLPHLSDDPEFLDRFLDEARIAVNLTHGNIVPVFELGEVNGQYFIAMEHIDGWDLRTAIRAARQAGEPWPLEAALFAGVQAARGLAYAHSRTDESGQPLRIVHRDISPANLLLSRDGEVKIVDFGIASARSRMGSTQTGQVRGKVAYMSPEQAAGVSVDNRSDVFSLGVVIYELLSGRRPFDGETDAEILAALRSGNYPPLQKLRPTIPDRVADVVERALVDDVAERWQSADDFELALADALNELSGAYSPRPLVAWLKQLFPAAERAGKSGGLDALLQSELERLNASAATPSASLRLTPSTGTVAGPAPALRRAPTPAAPNDRATETIGAAAGMPALTQASEARPRSAVVGWWLFAAAMMAAIATVLITSRSPDTGTLQVRSLPAAGRVFIDGSPAGVTTLRQNIETGVHVVRVELPGYASTERTVEVRADELHTVELALTPAAAPVTFESIPGGAMVHLTGQAPFVAGNSVMVVAGDELELLMELPGHRRHVEQITLRPGQERYVVRLQPLPADTDTAGPDSGAPTEPSIAATTPRNEDRPARSAEPRATSDAGSDERPETPDASTVMAAETGTGTLSLQFRQAPFVGEVEVAGRSLGRWNRVPFELPVGEHELVVRNASHGTEFRARVSIRDGQDAMQVVSW